MGIVFIIKDKSQRQIYLSKERWDHIQKHPEMSGQIEKIKETLENPYCIINFDSEVHFYYRFYKSRKEYLCIS